jgi:hypothetical protein
MSRSILRRAGLVLTAAVVAAALLATSASAAPSGGTADGASGNAQPLAKFAKPTSIRFEAVYNAEGYYGPVKCVGHRQTNEKKYPGSRDREHCRSTSGKPLLTVAPGEHRGFGEWFPNSSGWSSDYDGKAAEKQEYTVNSNGMAFNTVVYYPAA